MSDVLKPQTPTSNPATRYLTAETQRIRKVLDVLPLPDDTTTVAHRELGATEIALLEPEPDRQMIAASLERLTLSLAASGALDHAGQALSGPLGTLADWLGTTGSGIRRLLS